MKLEAYKMFIYIVVTINYIVLLVMRLAWLWLRELLDDIKVLDKVWAKFIDRDPGRILD